MVLALELDSMETKLEVEELLEVVETLVEEEEVVLDFLGVGVADEVDDGVGVAEMVELLAALVEELAAEPPTGKTTMFAEEPLGMVTTQKLAPPAPAA